MAAGPVEVEVEVVLEVEDEDLVAGEPGPAQNSASLLALHVAHSSVEQHFFDSYTQSMHAWLPFGCAAPQAWSKAA